MKNFFRLAVIIGALPNTLTNGTTADATQVMADLNWIVNQVNANAVPTANVAFTNQNNSFTVAQSGTAASAPAHFPIASQVQNQVFNTLSSTLGTNAITARVSALTLTAYANGQVFTFLPSQINSGDTTLAIDGLNPKHFLNAGSALSGGELRPLIPMSFFYDSTRDAFPLLNGTPFVQGPNITASGTLNLGAQEGDYHQIDGTGTVTAITLPRGRLKWLEMTSSVTFTHGASLIMPASVSVNAFPGDIMAVRGEAGNVVRAAPFPGRGVSGQVGGAEVLLCPKKTASASASITFTQADFDWFAWDVIIIRGVGVRPVNDAIYLTGNVSLDGGGTYQSGANSYAWNYNSVVNGTNVPSSANATDTKFLLEELGTGQSNSTTYAAQFELTIPTPRAAFVKSMLYRASYFGPTASFFPISVSGMAAFVGSTAAINGVQIQYQTGNISVGDFYAYGLKRT